MTRLILAALTLLALALALWRKRAEPVEPEPESLYVPMAAWLPQSMTVSASGGAVSVKAHDTWRN